MFFRNAVMFRFPTSLSPAFDNIEELLEESALKPVGAMEMATSGFVPPMGKASSALHVRQGDVLWLSLATESRILPPAVIAEVLQARIEEIEEQEGVKVGGRRRKQLKDDVTIELMARAFTKTSRTSVLIDLENGLAVVDTSSRKVAEEVISEIRRCMGSFPALPLNAESAPAPILSQLLTGQGIPEGFELGEEAELKEGDGGIIKVSRQELACEEVLRHLESGKQVTRLHLISAERASFVIGEDLVIRKLKLLDGALDALDGERESLAAELDARLALFIGEFRAIAKTVFELFSVTSPDIGADEEGEGRREALSTLRQGLRSGTISIEVTGATPPARSDRRGASKPAAPPG